jgi:hypothetical protein
MGNVISGNTGNGIGNNGEAAVTIQGNRIGTDATGEVAIPNAVGISSSNGTGLKIGGTGAFDGNLISGNGYGMMLFADGALVQGNFVGVDGSHVQSVPNTNAGIQVQSSFSPALAEHHRHVEPRGQRREPRRVQRRGGNRARRRHAQHDARQLDP